MDMLATSQAAVVSQHLIDPEICIRCNTCEATCPTGAITHDSRNYVVKAEVCNGCMACVPPCPTGAIDHWHSVARSKVYPIDAQLTWDELPAALEWPESLSSELDQSSNAVTSLTRNHSTQKTSSTSTAQLATASNGAGSTVAPHSALKPTTNLHTPKNPIQAKVTGNFRVTALGTSSDTHHIVLDFGSQTFPVLEGQSIGIIPSGVDANGKPHFARQYSIASPRNGERPGYNNLSLTVKRVLLDYDGNPVRGVASNYVCDLNVGDTVQVIGPFGNSFLMPNHAPSHLIMICTGTGSAPMRAMTEWRRRERQRLSSAVSDGAAAATSQGRLMLFFGARTPEELPYFGPLLKLPKDFIDLNFAFSRVADQPKRYVQDLLQERSNDIAGLLQNSNTYTYVCGLKGMEEGVLASLQSSAEKIGLNWASLSQSLREQGRLHLETY